jgi:nicotinamidase-related amidase
MARHYLQADQSVFMIIDLQENLMKVMDRADKVYKNTQLVLAVCRQMGIPVVVTEQYPKGLGHTVAEVSDSLGEHRTLEKFSFSACSDDAIKLFREFNCKQILIAGSETHICIFQTVRDLIGVGFEVFVLIDAVCSRFKENYKNGLELMREEGAVITNAETVIFDLLKVAGTPEFKAIAPLLK